MNPTTQTLVPATAYDLQRMLDRQREEIDRHWQELIERYAKRLETAWRKFSDDVDVAASDDLPAEELAPLFTAFAELRRLGVRFDPRFIAKIDWLRAGLRGTETDADADGADENLRDDGFGTNLPPAHTALARKLIDDET